MPLFLTIYMNYCQNMTTLLTIYAYLLIVTAIFFATAILLTLKTKTWKSTFYFTIWTKHTNWKPYKKYCIHYISIYWKLNINSGKNEINQIKYSNK